MVTLRPYRPDDLDALYDICLKTGDAGQDASGLHNDARLLGHIYSAPYGVLEPEQVIVAEDEAGVAGYIVGTHDTEAFSARQEREWWPALRAHYADAEGMTETDKARIAAIMTPHGFAADLVSAYPAHIHMNLLPRLRGKGTGSQLLAMWVDQARAAGVAGIHLAASARNTGGVAFWSRSFKTQRDNGETVWFTMDL